MGVWAVVRAGPRARRSSGPQAGEPWDREAAVLGAHPQRRDPGPVHLHSSHFFRCDSPEPLSGPWGESGAGGRSIRGAEVLPADWPLWPSEETECDSWRWKGSSIFHFHWKPCVESEVQGTVGLRWQRHEDGPWRTPSMRGACAAWGAGAGGTNGDSGRSAVGSISHPSPGNKGALNLQRGQCKNHKGLWFWMGLVFIF